MPQIVDAPNRFARLTRRGVCIVGVALVLTACSANIAPGGSSRSRIDVSGSVTAGPTCPVERVGQPCPPAPVHATVVATGAAGEPVAQATTEADGHYAFTVPPGRYTFSVEATGGFLPRCPTKSATVKLGPPEQVDFVCDTGIR